MSGCFSSETVFNLSRKKLSKNEIEVLETSLDYAPIQRRINEPELKTDFEDFVRRIRVKWHFRNHSSVPNGQISSFKVKSNWKPPKGHAALELFLSKLEKERNNISPKELGYSNMTSEEWKVMQSLADDRNIVIKKADKGSCEVVWDCEDYLLEAQKQLQDKNVYK